MAGGETTRAAAASVARTFDDTRRVNGGGGIRIDQLALWAIPAIAIAALLVYLLGRPTEQVVQQGVSTAAGLDGRRGRYRQAGYRQYQ